MKKLSALEIAVCGMFAALMCICGPLSVPIGPIPVSLTNLVIYLVIMVLSARLSLVSYLVYLLLGIAGLPVFSGFAGGPAKLIGPTGGYLIGFIFTIIIAGSIYELSGRQPVITGLGMFLGLIVAYAFGTVWFVYQTGMEIAPALAVCVWPFIPFDIIKIVVAVIFGRILRRAIYRSGTRIG